MDVLPQNVQWLIPEEKCPCDIFLHFRGQFPQALTAGQLITIATLEKLAKVQCRQVYVRRQDLALWQKWASERHTQPAASAGKKKPDEQKDLYGNKRAELFSHLQKSMLKRVEGNAKLEAALEAALENLQKVAKNPMLDWYFQQFHEPPVLFQHCGRVAYAAAAFCYLHCLCGEKEIESLIFASLIHELEGDPATSLNGVVSQQTLTLLEKRQSTIPEDVIALIRLQDELCSGKGFPSNKEKDDLPVPARVFSLFNHFEHLRMRDASSRRARFEYAKQQMTARKGDFDESLFPLFWEFWEKYVELVA